MLSYAFIDWKAPVTPPARLPNGGLYTGETARGNWGNVPVVPESHILTTQNLLSAHPPDRAVVQPGSQERPGNNHVTHPYHGPVPAMSSLYAQK